MPAVADQTDLNTRGHARQREEAALLALALFGPSDYVSAHYFWKREAQPAYRGLLDGQGWTWDDQKQRYISDHGKKLGDNDQKALSLLLSSGTALSYQRDARRMTRGEVAIEEWQDGLADQLRNLYLTQTALSTGGFNRITARQQREASGNADRGLAFSLIRLQDFAKTVEAGDIDEAAVLVRAGLYAASSNTIYELGRRSSHRDAKDDKGRALFLYERNILGPNENHCESNEHTDGCLEVSEAGWQPISTLPLPGERSCRMNCHCGMQYELAPNIESLDPVLSSAA